MPANPVNLQVTRVYGTGAIGTPASVHVCVPSPVRGRIIEVGFSPSSVLTSGVTLTVATNVLGASSTASSYVTIVTSTLGTFSSTNLFEGACASAIPPSPAFVNVGDGIQFICSGGQSSTVAGTVYADIIRA